MRKKGILGLYLLLLLFPLATEAQFGAGLNQLDKAVGPQTKVGLQGDLTGSVTTIVTTALSVVGTIFLLLTIYGGIRWMLARGDEGEIGTSKEIIKAAIIGLVIVMSAYAVTAFVGSKLSGGSGGGVSSNPYNLKDCSVIGGRCSPWKVGDNGVPDAAGYCASPQEVCVKDS